MAIPTVPTAITPIVIPNAYAAAGIDITYVACDAANGNSVPSTGREILIFKGSGSPYLVTIWSSADPQGRLTDLTKTVGSTEEWATPLLPGSGFVQAGATIMFTAANAAVSVACLRLP